jgi:hypothetical protein
MTVTFVSTAVTAETLSFISVGLYENIKGNFITCYFDAKKSLEVEDATFPDAGKIGLWSESDARSYFDDLTVSVPE